MSLISHLDTHTIFDARRDFDGFFYLFFFFSTSVTLCTGFFDLCTSSTTLTTYRLLFHDTKNRLYSFAHLTTSVTMITCLGRSSFSMTGITRNTLRVRYLTRNTTDRIFERYLHPNLDITTDISTLSCSPCTSSESTAKKLRKNITEITRIKTSSESPKTSATHPFGRSESIVVSFFLRIG